MRFGIVTLFPEMFAALTEFGISSRAIKQGLVSVDFWNPRDFTSDRHRTVDDKPYGGGPGMLMKTEPLLAAIAAARQGLLDQASNDQGNGPVGSNRVESDRVKTIYLSPQGKPLRQAMLSTMASTPGNQPDLVLVCGRYQGIDARVIEAVIDEEWSLGDFVLSGGELAAMAVMDALIRLQPGALGAVDSATEDSFSEGLLHWPEYTRPESVAGMRVPATLLSGDHAAIRRWRALQSLGMTWLKRPELLDNTELNGEQQQLLDEFINEYNRVSDKQD
ncbi:MAG: tRNA (guanosine(37)-N1)-methyltransferase TrmD [Pseudohongiellaceae bacterium]